MSEPCQVEFCLARGSRQAGTILLARRRAGGIVGTKLEGRLGRVVHEAGERVREVLSRGDGNQLSGIWLSELPELPAGGKALKNFLTLVSLRTAFLSLSRNSGTSEEWHLITAVEGGWDYCR